MVATLTLVATVSTPRQFLVSLRLRLTQKDIFSFSHFPPLSPLSPFSLSLILVLFRSFSFAFWRELSLPSLLSLSLFLSLSGFTLILSCLSSLSLSLYFPLTFL